jgi:hypothetical protein
MARSLARNILGVGGACCSSEMILGRMTSTYSLTRSCTKPNNKLVSACWSTFGVRTSHMQLELTRLTTAWTSRKPPPSPIILYFAPFHEAHIQMVFCPKTPKWESRNSQNWDSCNFAGP